MARYFLEVKYNGLAFHGSQVQGEIPTVQLAINKVLSTLLREEVISFGASRTDEGVHALCNYYHFDTEQELTPKFQYKVNAILQPELSCTAMYKSVDPELNCRFAAVSRRYRYRIYSAKDPFRYQRGFYFPYSIDKQLLDATAKVLPEYENFETFSKRNTQSRTFICHLSDSHWEDHGDEMHYVVEGNRFLRGMVRGLVGTQLLVARGKMTIEEFRSAIEAKDCTKADFSVPGHGLYLEHIAYPEGALEQIS